MNEIGPQDISRTSGGADADGLWMSYGELGRARGISRASAARLARRHRWRRQTDNHGTVRVFVPSGADEPADRHPTDVRIIDPGVSSLAAGALAALEVAVAALREQYAGVQQQMERAEKGRDAANARADALQHDLDAARAGRQQAAQAADAANRADAERKARGLLARLRAALRGE
jgi:hypothetical protein